MEKIGRGDDYSPERLRTKFIDSIIDKDYDHVLLDAQTHRLSLRDIQETLVAEEVRKVKRTRALEITNRRMIPQNEELPSPIRCAGSLKAAATIL